MVLRVLEGRRAGVACLGTLHCALENWDTRVMEWQSGKAAGKTEQYYWVLALMSGAGGTFRRFGITRASVGNMAEIHSENESSFLGFRLEPTKWCEAYRKVRPQFVFLA